jgi:cell division protein FtsW
MINRIEHSNLRSQEKSLDVWLLVSALALVLIGLIVIYDASIVTAFRDFNDKFHYLKNQLVWAVLGTVALSLFSFFDYHKLIKFGAHTLAGSLLFLLLVLIPHIGTEILGAKRWINIEGFTFQPSEFAKLAVVFYATFIMSKFHNFKMRLVDTLVVYFLPILIITGLVVIQPDLGTALIFFGLTVVIYFLGNAPFWHFLLAIPVIVLGAIAAVIKEPYRIERIKAFMDPAYDPLGASYQINQIIIALSSGGLLGVGAGASRSKFEFIPEIHSDAIFAVIVEEVGFLGGLTLIALFVFLLTRAIKIAKEAPDYEGKILAGGIVGLIGMQIVLNLSAIVALVPLTGIPLPFISYGGSSLFVTLISIGILLNIKKQS